MAKLTWPKLMAQKKRNPRWVGTPQGARPVDPRSRRTMRRGTARMKANRGSERMHRLIRSAVFAVFEMMAVALVATVFFGLLWELYDKIEWGKAVLQAAGTATVIMVWLVFTRERVKHEQHTAQAHERELELATQAQREAGDRTARLDRVDPTGPAPVRDIRTSFERDFDQRNDWDKPV